MNNPTKKCKTCGKDKTADQFWNNPKTRDRLKTSCIDCCKEYNKSHYQQNRDERIKQVSQYQQSRHNNT